MIIDQHTDLYGVIGKPVGHSLSPTMHNTAFSAAGLNAVYLAFETDDIRECVRGARALGIKGMSITIPFKSEIIPYLDEVDPLAERIGAVNTVVNRDNRMVGYNTDALGALKALEDRISLKGRTCIILGAGGAARAIGFILRENGVDISVTNRSRKRGERLAFFLECPFIPLNEISDTSPDLLIQTTPVGMYPNIDQSPVPEAFITNKMVVMDIIYTPLETRLIRTAKTRGCITISGLSMFINQGALQFRLWTNIEPPVSVMTRAVKTALAGQNERD